MTMFLLTAAHYTADAGNLAQSRVPQICRTYAIAATVTNEPDVVHHIAAGAIVNAARRHSRSRMNCRRPCSLAA
jgi:hypothetical protein